jgi:hypothetical protein
MSHYQNVDRADPPVAANTVLARRERSRDLWIVMSGLLITFVVALIAMRDPGDDADIVFRYVVRWLHGRGLTFNDGEFVEGFSSLSWTLLLAGVSRVTGADVALAAVVLNVIVLLATGVAIDYALRVAGASPTARAVTMFAFSAAYVYARVCFFGLELGLFGLVLTVFCALILRASDERGHNNQKRSIFPALGVVGGLLFATRPETVPVLPAVLLALLVRSTARARSLLRAAAGYGLVVAGIETWRRMYYGGWLPNSAVAKSISLSDPHVIGTVEQRLIDGATYVYAAYRTYPILAVIALALLALAARRALSARSILLCIPVVWGHFVVVENGGDWMQSYRLITMYFPALLLVGWSVATDLRTRYGELSVLVITAVALVLHISASVRAYNDEPYIALHFDNHGAVRWTHNSEKRGFAYVYETAGHALKDVWKSGDIVAAESVGIIGYLAPEMYLHDPTGLMDRVLAHDPDAAQGTFGRMNWRYSMSLKPAVVLLHWWPHQNPWPAYGVGYPAQFDRYCIRAPIQMDPVVLYVIIRKDHPQYGDAIRTAGGQPLQVDAGGNAYCPP